MGLWMLLGESELRVIFSIFSIIHQPIYPHKCLALFRSINNRLGSPPSLSPRGSSSLRAVLMEFRSLNVLHNWSMIRKRSGSNLIALSSISVIQQDFNEPRMIKVPGIPSRVSTTSGFILCLRRGINWGATERSAMTQGMFHQIPFIANHRSPSIADRLLKYEHTFSELFNWKPGSIELKTAGGA